MTSVHSSEGVCVRQAATNYRVFGAPRAIGCFHGVVALGMSSGVTFVLLPRGLSADAGPDAGPKVSLFWPLDHMLLTLEAYK